MEIAILVIVVLILIGVSSNNHTLDELDKRLTAWEAVHKDSKTEESTDGDQRS